MKYWAGRPGLDSRLECGIVILSLSVRRLWSPTSLLFSAYRGVFLRSAVQKYISLSYIDCLGLCSKESFGCLVKIAKYTVFRRGQNSADRLPSSLRPSIPPLVHVKQSMDRWMDFYEIWCWGVVVIYVNTFQYCRLHKHPHAFLRPSR